MNRNNIHEFSSLEEENLYLRKKLDFLIEHSKYLADKEQQAHTFHLERQIQELRDIKNSRSWKITFPLRLLSKRLKDFYEAR
ncbi:hypothetical protein [Vibrio cholerae]|uniref:hypothetical protein n=1 Tax=Vibrio cholerae TaxID=666 RepID=UPI0004E32096|nr:hypothetical protein [Vibrio cholerae]EGR1088996.1 hypothetical protein [Vibrio cholerae]KFE23528.1 hypothetical protein DA89_1807 [Vibrio cholerae]TXZ28692.1 hypothetical protein FXE66_16955 [Vibrio cholerae]BCN21481.1 hypothetical protein [Vibrio cholerae]